MRRAALAGLGAAALLAGCAEFGGAPGSGLPPLREQRLQALEQRLDEVTRRLEGLGPQAQGLTGLEAEVRGLRGDVEQMRHDLEVSDQRTRELYDNLDRRLAQLETAGRAAPAPSPGGATSAPASQEEEAAYSTAFDQLRARKVPESIAGFRAQLARWPQGRYAANGRYWLGEAHYARKEYGAALESFRALLAQFPDSPKAPDAMFKIGVCQAETKRPNDARATWRRVVADYPGSNAAALARQRLDPLK